MKPIEVAVHLTQSKETRSRVNIFYQIQDSKIIIKYSLIPALNRVTPTTQQLQDHE
jgi:hypothetical protein